MKKESTLCWKKCLRKNCELVGKLQYLIQTAVERNIYKQTQIEYGNVSKE